MEGILDLEQLKAMPINNAAHDLEVEVAKQSNIIASQKYSTEFHITNWTSSSCDAVFENRYCTNEPSKEKNLSLLIDKQNVCVCV